MRKWLWIIGYRLKTEDLSTSLHSTQLMTCGKTGRSTGLYSTQFMTGKGCEPPSPTAVAKAVARQEAMARQEGIFWLILQKRPGSTKPQPSGRLEMSYIVFGAFSEVLNE
jgi:hypothetical protein